MRISDWSSDVCSSDLFCCEGCAGAAQWIRDADLGDYYQLRSAPAGQVGVEPMDFSAWDRDDLLHEHVHAVDGGREITVLRSEEGRVGNECVSTSRFRWSRNH